jgi:hypothetical protein
VLREVIVESFPEIKFVYMKYKNVKELRFEDRKEIKEYLN